MAQCQVFLKACIESFPTFFNIIYKGFFFYLIAHHEITESVRNMIHLQHPCWRGEAGPGESRVSKALMARRLAVLLSCCGSKEFILSSLLVFLFVWFHLLRQGLIL